MMVLGNMEQDLHNLKDDMVAFIEGHGMRRFHGAVRDDMPSVQWASPRDQAERHEQRDEQPADGWKDFVELAKASGVPFVTMSHVSLEAEDVEFLVDRLEEVSYLSDEDMEEARWLKNFIGKIGHLQLGFPCHGVMFLYEVSTDWYVNFERLESTAEEFGSMLMDESDQDDN
jgi:hypothetical protein